MRDREAYAAEMCNTQHFRSEKGRGTIVGKLQLKEAERNVCFFSGACFLDSICVFVVATFSYGRTDWIGNEVNRICTAKLNLERISVIYRVGKVTFKK